VARGTRDGDLPVVAESPDDWSVVFRIYCQWPVDGRRHIRPPILTPGDDDVEPPAEDPRARETGVSDG
jgi:hypothetical protein